jgi:serine/threonine-protein kinase
MALLSGSWLGPYQIEAPLGAGGMGEVYRARDVRLGRTAALKLLDPDLSSDVVNRGRFEDEARSASTLNHPNIVTIYGVGESGERMYIAMELIEGRTLRARMADGRVGLAEALALGAQVTAALAAAHEQGIVHRDLKPDNVMVTPEGHVKILDFGIATRLAAGSGDGMPEITSATADGGVIGTVGYMAPEQAAGRSATRQSDQFAFGVILYELLTGRRAFQRESRAATLAAILCDEPESLARLAPSAPPDVVRLVERCLSKTPERRFAQTRDLETATRALAAKAASPDVIRFTRRHLLAIAGGTALAAATGVGVWRFWPPRSLAVLPFSSQSDDRETDYLGLGLTESLIWRLRQLPLSVKPLSLVSNFTADATDPRAFGRQIRADYVVGGRVDARNGRLVITASLVDVGSGSTLWQQTFDRASADIFTLWDQVATAVVDDGLHLRLTRDERLKLLSRPTSSVEAYDAFLRARPLQMSLSADDYYGARALLERAVVADPKFAEAWVALAGTYWTAALEGFDRPREAWPEVERSMAAAAAINPTLPDLHFGRAIRSFFADWDWPGANREWQAASARPDEDIQPELLLTYAMSRWAMRDTAAALAIVRRARRIDPLSPTFAQWEAMYLTELRRWDDAAAIYNGILATHPESDAAYFGLAEVRRGQQRMREAVAALVQGHRAGGADERGALGAAMASATGEDGYRQVEMAAVTEIELPQLEAERAQRDYVSPLNFARAYARLGDRDRAFRYLSDAIDDRSPGLVFLNADHAWDALRPDPRFSSFVSRVGLPGGRT